MTLHTLEVKRNATALVVAEHKFPSLDWLEKGTKAHTLQAAMSISESFRKVAMPL